MRKPQIHPVSSLEAHTFGVRDRGVRAANDTAKPEGFGRLAQEIAVDRSPALTALAKRANSPLKRLMDLTFTLLLLLLGAPLMLVIALAIKLDDGGPVFYRHSRVGRGGRAFACLKFRSMRPDSAARLRVYLASNPAAAEEWRQFYKLKRDPRITRMGGFLRRTSLDELPQLLNVLAGEMSLVGCRPVVFEELRYYGPDRAYYLLARPGLTGLWQISGRSDTGYAKRVELDRQYVENASLGADLAILFKTPFALLAQKGAY